MWPPLNLRSIQKDVESLGFRARKGQEGCRRVRVRVLVMVRVRVRHFACDKKDFPRTRKVRHNSASTLILGIFVPAAGLQAKGNLRYLVFCGVFFFRAQMPQHTHLSFSRIFVDGFSGTL